jgi:hypothetical protein
MLGMILRMCHLISFVLVLHLKIVEYIPQGHRFNIFEDIGCFPYTYLTPVGIVLVFVPPVLIGWICTIYGGRVLLFDFNFKSLPYTPFHIYGHFGV